jgi:hypothetical protein
MEDLLGKLKDLDHASEKTHSIQLYSIGYGWLLVNNKIISPFVSIQDCREKMYRQLLKYKNDNN